MAVHGLTDGPNTISGQFVASVEKWVGEYWGGNNNRAGGN
jgi:hypothetical protein